MFRMWMRTRAQMELEGGFRPPPEALTIQMMLEEMERELFGDAKP